MISGILKVEVSVISRSQRLRLITLTETLIIRDITKTESNNCFVIHCFEENNEKTHYRSGHFIFKHYKTMKCRKVKCISVSLSSSNFSVSCWVDETNREAILTSLSVNFFFFLFLNFLLIINTTYIITI